MSTHLIYVDGQLATAKADFDRKKEEYTRRTWEAYVAEDRLYCIDSTQGSTQQLESEWYAEYTAPYQPAQEVYNKQKAECDRIDAARAEIIARR